MDEELAHKVRNHSNLKHIIDIYYNSIKEACNETFKINRGNKRKIRGKSVPWWTPELTVMRKRVNALRRRYQRTYNNEQLREVRRNLYMDGNKQYQTKINTEKLKSWKEFCSATDGSNPWTAVYKIVARKLKGNNTLTTLRKEDGTYTVDTSDTLQYMLKHFFPQDSEQDDTERHKQLRRLTTEPMNTPEDIEFTTAEILNILQNFNPRKSPGEDGITSDILLYAFRMFPCFFTALYNKCLSDSIFPIRWKRSVIIPIIKHGKTETHSVTKYRPISLLNINGKILEKLMINRIEHHINSRKLFNVRQFGFMAQKSTVDAAMEMKSFVKRNLPQFGYIVLVSLDVKGAFDAAWWPTILNNLREMECPSNLYRLCQDYFKNRTASLSSNEYQTEKQVEKGCPQGSCCGPGLWNVLYNSMLNLQFTQRTEVIAFADDILIMTKGKSKLDVGNYCNQDLKKIELWANENKINFNDSKSKVLMITRKKKINNESINIYLNNKTLEQVDTLKYLGIYVDKKFRFDHHINQIHDKAISIFHTLSKAAKLKWGIGNKALHTIYMGAIQPILTYGAPVWGDALQIKTNLTKIQRVQRLFNIKITKAYRTISYEASCVLAGIQPIDITIQGIIKQYDSIHGDVNYDAPLTPSDWMHPAQIPQIQEAKEGTNYFLKIYTDGSKKEENVGAAAVIYKFDNIFLNLKYRLGGNCSNNQAEQLAVLKALQEIQNISNTSGEEKTAAIYSDSKVALALFQKNSKHNSIVEDILKTIKNLEQKQWTIHFKWVKAHIGDIGNEYADELAKEAAKDLNLHVIYNKIPKSLIKCRIRENGHQLWQNRWNATNKGAQCRLFFPYIKERLNIKIPITPQFTALISGHGKTNDYLHRFHIIDNPGCACGCPRQTANHMIYLCKEFRQQRTTLIADIYKNGGNWPVTNNELVTKHLKQFCKFINSMNL